ncbi:MAG: RsmB/NOP family class I SAM-dependent RNA methyltransferase [Asgard group archaeon]|nr:RsmB/NOP family class I SAM-dependent RNA methyltransferase [Asgard group archaeon]
MSSSNSHSDTFNLGDQYGYQRYMIERFIEMIGEAETKKLLYFNERKLHKVIRLNSLRIPIPQIKLLLEKKGVELEDIEGLPEGKRIVKSSVPIGATTEYLNGYYMLQGKNSLYPSRILNPKKGELIGDFAAAPGGKTSHLAQLMENEGTILASEISTNRCRILRSNLARMGVRNTIIINMDSKRISSLKLAFDKVLLDAPCSGSGIIVTDKSRKQSKSRVDIMNYHSNQVSLLSETIKTVKPGGELVYCTCSLEPEENELVISKILEQETVQLVEIDLEGNPGIIDFEDYNINPQIAKTRRLYPHKTSGEGFFIAKMVKL